jgi:hypothetical protein
MPQPNDLSRSLVALDQNSTIITVVDLCRRVALRRLSDRFLLGRLAGAQAQEQKPEPTGREVASGVSKSVD